MAHPQRKAARYALEKIQRIQEWEKLSENSQLFIECAAKIDAEMEAEISKKEVMTSDLDIFDEDDENDEKDEEQDDNEDEYDASFVVSDASDDEQIKNRRRLLPYKPYKEQKTENCEFFLGIVSKFGK
jgi:hypothetical protein